MPPTVAPAANDLYWNILLWKRYIQVLNEVQKKSNPVFLLHSVDNCWYYTMTTITAKNESPMKSQSEKPTYGEETLLFKLENTILSKLIMGVVCRLGVFHSQKPKPYTHYWPALRMFLGVNYLNRCHLTSIKVILPHNNPRKRRRWAIDTTTPTTLLRPDPTVSRCTFQEHYSLPCF